MQIDIYQWIEKILVHCMTTHELSIYIPIKFEIDSLIYSPVMTAALSKTLF